MFRQGPEDLSAKCMLGLGYNNGVKQIRLDRAGLRYCGALST